MADVLLTELSFLYVEDDIFSCEVMQILLQRVLGISRLMIFEDSANFMQRLEGIPYKPDVFLLDIYMRPHDGIEILKMIRESSRYKDSKVIALTASVVKEDVAQLRAAGFDGLISKPIRQQYFPTYLRLIIAGKEKWFVG